MSKKHYVVVAAVSEDGNRIVLLTKQQGPAHLLGKLTLPGGHIDAGDVCAQHAAARELAEETGVTWPVDAFELISTDDNATRSIACYLAFGDISKARTMESEPVTTRSIDDLASLPDAFRSQYAPDFFQMLEPMMARIHEVRRSFAIARRPSGYVMPYERADYAQTIERERPHVLLDEDRAGPTKVPPEKRMWLRYRYLDTGETILVPAGPTTVTPAMKVAGLRFQADEKDRKARDLLQQTPSDWTPWMAQQVAARLSANAVSLRDVARGIESGELPFDAKLNHVSEDAPPRSSDPDHTPMRRKPR